MYNNMLLILVLEIMLSMVDSTNQGRDVISGHLYNIVLV